MDLEEHNFLFFQLLALVHTELNRRNGQRTSGILFIYWLLTVLCNTFRIYSIVRKWGKMTNSNWIEMTFFIVSTCELLLCCFADKSPLYLSRKKSRVSIEIIVLLKKI